MAMITLNSATKFIEELYQDYNISIVKAKRYINSNAQQPGSIINDGYSKKLLRAQSLISSKSTLYRAFALMRPKVIALAISPITHNQ